MTRSGDDVAKLEYFVPYPDEALVFEVDPGLHESRQHVELVGWEECYGTSLLVLARYVSGVIDRYDLQWLRPLTTGAVEMLEMLMERE